jgi:hypothetical protein
MAINFPSNPNVNDTHVVGSTIWTWDGSSWNGVSHDPIEIATLTYPSVDGTAGQLLITDGAGNLSFGNLSPATLSTVSIDSLSDVDITSVAPTDGQVLVWDNASSKFIPGSNAGYSDSSVDTHLNTSAATSNQVLSWDGADYAWVAQSSGGGGTLGASISGVEESFSVIGNATGTVTHDCDNGHIFYHKTPSADWTVNLTNLGLTNNYATAVTIIIQQGATAYIPSALQIGGASTEIRWASDTTPTGNADSTDQVTFSIMTDGTTTFALGQLSTYGQGTGTFSPPTYWANFLTEAKLEASDAQLSDWFGNSVSISDDGNTIVIGAYQEDDTATGAGSAYIYTRSGTTWTQIQKIQASDAENSDEFGTSVKISGDGNTMIIGADKEDTNGNWAGSAYIFTKSGSTWSEQDKIQPTDSTTEQFFGKSVSISDDGNTAIIGAPGQSTGPAAAYIFTRSGTTWSQEAKISSPVDPTASYFGGSVDISDDGNTAIIGYSLEDTTAGVDAGAAYIYTRSGSTWSQEAKLESDDAEASDMFGVAVSISGDGNTVVVGATGEDTAWDNSTQAGAGAAYVFARSGSTWSQEGKLQGNIVQTNTSFGHSVSISDDGNTVIVGAHRADAGYSDTGMSFLFTRSGTTWNRITDINALVSDRQANDYFGYSIAICGDGHTIVSGAYQDDTTVTDAGSAWVFTKGP